MADLKQLKTINFRQPKYIFPGVVYVILMFIGYSIFDYMGQEDPGPAPVDYLNAELPTPNIKEEMGSKRSNMRSVYGNVSDLTKIDGYIEDDRDSLRQLDEYSTLYDEDDAREVAERKAEQERMDELRKMEAQLRKDSAERADLRKRDFSVPRSDSAVIASQEARRQQMYDQLQRELGLINGDAEGLVSENLKKNDSIIAAKGGADGQTSGDGLGGRQSGGGGHASVRALDDEDKSHEVVKVGADVSSHFNTVSGNSQENGLIKAIVDEEVKAVDGTRVRLRLLDDVEIDGVRLSKGTYMYCTMSGFGSQRVKCKVESMLVGDQLLKVNLSVYDCSDGLEGLYVPQSAFRETAKNIGSSALSGGGGINSITGGYGSNGLAQMGMQAVQQAYQQTTQAISKAIRKNKVRVKYGTEVYLVNGRKN